jgi:threonine dehydrogenase-like Zn-dependent dehydrogenase
MKKIRKPRAFIFLMVSTGHTTSTDDQEAAESGRVNLQSLVTHRFGLDEIEEAYDLIANQRDGVLKVAIIPWRNN